ALIVISMKDKKSPVKGLTRLVQAIGMSQIHRDHYLLKHQLPSFQCAPGPLLRQVRRPGRSVLGVNFSRTTNP
ncbi:MAG: hypothetical protein ACPH5G_12220, partial [Pseudooceanicola atlanticus]